MANRTVEIGDDTITIGRFRGLRALEAAAAVSRMMKEVPQLQDEITKFSKEYRANNSIELTFALSRTPAFLSLGLSREDFEANGGTINLPEPPTVQQQLIAALPTMLDMARKHLTALIGVVTIGNDELEAADDNDMVEEAIVSAGKRIVRKAYVEQLAEVILASYEVLEDEFKGREEVTKRLGEAWTRVRRSMSQNPLEEMEAEIASTQETSSDSAQSSSIDSPTPTDGTGEPSSTASPGAS